MPRAKVGESEEEEERNGGWRQACGVVKAWGKTA